MHIKALGGLGGSAVAAEEIAKMQSRKTTKRDATVVVRMLDPGFCIRESVDIGVFAER